MAVEPRNRLGDLAGVPLAPTVVFDHPCARELAGVVVAGLGG